MSDAYDRQIEHRLEMLERVTEKHDSRITKVEVWRNTIISFFGGALFAAGYFAKPFADALKKLLPTLG